MPPQEDTTLELRDYLRVLRRRKWIIITTVIICVLAAFAMSARQTPVYTAATKVLLQKRLVDDIFVPTDQQNATDAATQRANEIQIMGSPEVVAEVAKRLGHEPASFELAPVEGTDVVQINSSSTKPTLAKDTANALAHTYIKVRQNLTIHDLQGAVDQLTNQKSSIDEEIFGKDLDLALTPPVFTNGVTKDARVTELSGLQSQSDAVQAQIDKYNVGISVAKQGGAQILAPAVTPTSPQNKNPLSNLLAGLAIGLVLGIALAFLREYLDDRIKTKEDLENATGQTVIGLIPELPDWKDHDSTQLISVSQPRSPAAEAYRTVRTSVEFLSLDQPIGSLQVTSAMASEGKTTTLANLAVTFARVGQRVIVLCCDLRRPRVHEFFGLSNRVGFTSMLLGDAPASEAIQPVRGDLPIGLVASGPLAPNPAELLASKRAVSVIEELDAQCDLLLIDSPPVLPVTDAQVISGLVDGVLLVGSAGSSTKRDVRRAVELLRQVDAPLIGTILNGAHSKHDSLYVYAGDRYYTYTAADENGAAPKTRKGRRNKRAQASSSR